MDLPKDEQILLIKGISGVFHTPKIVEGRTSRSGKTISLELEDGRSYRLDTEKILTGGLEVRRATTFELYRPEAFIQRKKANQDPANFRNMDADDLKASNLPEPTHRNVEEVTA